jgi:hypothetical protein
MNIRNVKNSNQFSTFKQFQSAVAKVNYSATNQAKDVQALLIAAAFQCTAGNSNWINELLKQDFRGMKREAIVAWIMAFCPVKKATTKLISGHERIASIALKKGFASEEAQAKIEEGTAKQWDSFHTEANGQKVAEEFKALTVTNNFIKKMMDNLDKAKPEDVMQAAMKLAKMAQDLEVEAHILKLEAEQSE